MAHTITLTVDDRTYTELEARARTRGETPESVAADVVQALCTDPLYKHLGAYPTSVLGWADQVHETIGQATTASKHTAVPKP